MARNGTDAHGSARTGSIDWEKLTTEIRATVSQPIPIEYTVTYGGKPIILRGHYWARLDASATNPMPAIVEFNPYRRRDGMLYADSMMYPYFAYRGYVCFRFDLQGTGDSGGLIRDEYTLEELAYCGQIINRLAQHQLCNGSVGMMGKSWSAINSLMVAAGIGQEKDQRPSPLKAVIFCCGTDDRWNDDVHYMGGAMMQDNFGWPSSMWGWLTLPPDPDIVGESWESMWLDRLRDMSFWFQQWAGHQTRDEYWSATSVRDPDRYGNIDIPVFVLSGWLDGYKNVVERAVFRLGELGKTVYGLIGPWGHKYPFDGYPRPQIDWLSYVTDHFWDRHLKGIEPSDPDWPQFTVWLGGSKDPNAMPGPANEAGRWVAETWDWSRYTNDVPYFLCADGSLSRQASPRSRAYAPIEDLTIGTTMLETSSWGEKCNDDLPWDQRPDDDRSFCFTSAPLTEDLDCLGYPKVNLILELEDAKPDAMKPANLAVRLCEVGPDGQSHLVSYRLFNLLYRHSDLRPPAPIPAGRFAASIPLNLVGHSFKKDWRLRVSISPGFYPTMWQTAEVPRLVLHVGSVDGAGEQSRLVLPIRTAEDGPRRKADDEIQERLKTPPCHEPHVDPEQFVETIRTERDAISRRWTEPASTPEGDGIWVRKVYDSGKVLYGGVLRRLWVDQRAEENYLLLKDQPMSVRGYTVSDSTLCRPDGKWGVRTRTETTVWTEYGPDGTPRFKYDAAVFAFKLDVEDEDHWTEKPVFEKRVQGEVRRDWV